MLFSASQKKDSSGSGQLVVVRMSGKGYRYETVRVSIRIACDSGPGQSGSTVTVRIVLLGFVGDEAARDDGRTNLSGFRVCSRWCLVSGGTRNGCAVDVGPRFESGALLSCPKKMGRSFLLDFVRSFVRSPARSLDFEDTQGCTSKLASGW